MHIKVIKEETEIFKRNKKLIEHQTKRMGSRPAINSLVGKKNLIGLEIGILFGINSVSILNKLNISFLYLIDPFLEKPLKEAYPEFVDTNDVEIIARRILDKFKDKIEIIKDFSYNVADKIPNSLDFIYIDGDHSKEGIKKDLELYYNKVKPGGLFGGHDYVEDKLPELAVRGVVDNFFKDKETINNTHRDWWIIKS